MQVVTKIDEGICRARQSGIKMRCLTHHYENYWKNILKDCI